MPFRSKAQERYLYSQHPDIAKRWQAETPKGAKLPDHVHHKPTNPHNTHLKPAKRSKG